MQNKGYQNARCTSVGGRKWGFTSRNSKHRHCVEISGQLNCATALLSEESSLYSLNRRLRGHFGNEIDL